MDGKMQGLFAFPEAEIVLGVVAAVGVDLSQVAEVLAGELQQFGYRANFVWVSEAIPKMAAALGVAVELPEPDRGRRMAKYMEAGNEMRKAAGRGDLFALLAAARVAEERQGRGVALRTAHILLSLKRPEEVETLRQIYGAGFYLIGVFGSEQERMEYLRGKGVSEGDARELIQRDLQDEDREFGQRTRDTFHLADVFVGLRGDGFRRELPRFLRLLFGHPYTTPTVEEFAMYQAYAASLRSAQLGRQVGAAIVNGVGDLISVGCNEVPAPGGGSYWEGQTPDHRDHTRHRDSNDERKDAIIRDVLERLRRTKAFSGGEEAELAAALRESLLGDITEFGRAVHAEMDALLACGRSGVSAKGATLFTTTFPCHNCTRHLIGAGIRRVVYIEPYPKSQATNLHPDAIRLEEAESAALVPFDSFIGIGPRRFFDLFSMTLSSGYELLRKRDGAAVEWVAERDGRPRTAMTPWSYLEREQMAARQVDQLVRD
jgi:deoxycytidylate deaminase